MVKRGLILKEVEDFPKRIKIFFFVIVCLLFFGTVSFKFLLDISFKKAFIMTLETLAFMFHDDIVSVRILEVFLSIVGVFLVWWVLWSFADMILDGSLRKYLKIKYYSFKIDKMKDHYIIAGGGRIGEEIARVISLKTKNFLIIEKEEAVAKKLQKKGIITIQGDATEESVLKLANIQKAKKIILTLPLTEKNLLITLTAKELNPKIEVYSRADKESYVSKLKRAGAKIVIVPELVAADNLAKDINL